MPRRTAFILLAILALGASDCSSPTASARFSPTGGYRGVLVGSVVSGVIAINFPTDPAAGLPTGTLAITGGSTIALIVPKDYDGSQGVLRMLGGGYMLEGIYNYCATCGDVPRFDGGYNGPGAPANNGSWSASAVGPRLRVYCGTYTGAIEGNVAGGAWDFAVDDSNLVRGYASGTYIETFLPGFYQQAGILLFETPNLTATGTVDTVAGTASGTWADSAPASGSWTASTNGC